MSNCNIQYNEEQMVWYNTELIYLLNGAPLDEDDLEQTDKQHLKCDEKALEIINNPKTTLKYLKKTDDDETSAYTALSAACGAITGLTDYGSHRKPNFEIIEALLKKGGSIYKGYAYTTPFQHLLESMDEHGTDITGKINKIPSHIILLFDGLGEPLTEPLVERLTGDSKKLRTWEHGYKSAVEAGVPIIELDDSIKALISEHLRNMGGGTNKKYSRRKSSKRKGTKRK